MFEIPLDSTTSAPLAGREKRTYLSTLAYQIVVREDEKRSKNAGLKDKIKPQEARGHGASGPTEEAMLVRFNRVCLEVWRSAQLGLQNLDGGPDLVVTNLKGCCD
jgi:hypothetical protein